MAREFVNPPVAGIEEDEFEVISSFPSGQLAPRDIPQQEDEFEVISSFAPPARDPIQPIAREEVEEKELVEEPTTLGQIRSYLGRQAARSGARAFESIAGLPGDILKGAGSLVSAGVKKITGLDVDINKALDKVPHPFFTSQELKDRVTKPLAKEFLPKKYLKPQTRTEQIVDNVVGDLSVLLLPLKGKVPFGKTIASAFLGNVAQGVAEEIGASPTKQIGAKAIGMTLPYILGPKGLLKQARNLYKNTDTALKDLPKNLPVSSRKMQDAVKDLKKYVRTGVPTPGKEVLSPIANALERATKGEKTNLRNLWKMYKQINQNFKKHSSLSDVAEYLPKVNNAIRETIKGAAKQYPSFTEKALDATNMWRGIHEASSIRSFLRKIVGPKALKSKTARILITLNPGLLKKAGVGMGIQKVWDTLETLQRSPAARKIWSTALVEAQGKNAPAVLRSISALDKELFKVEKGR